MTDLLVVLPDFSIQDFANIVPSLEKHSITVADLLTGEPTDLAKRAQVPVREVRRLTDAVLQLLQEQLGLVEDAHAGSNGSHAKDTLVTTGGALLSQWRSISLLDDGLDATLGGGVPAGYLTEVTGESGVGKTQFLLTLLLAVQLPPPQGLGRSAVYISTEAPLATSRMSQLLSTHPRLITLAQEDKPSLSKVLSLQTPDLESQDHILRYQLPVAILRHDVGLVIIDSITANYRAEFDATTSRKENPHAVKKTRQGPISMARRSAQLLELGAHLRDLARKHNLAVVVANQVADRFDSTMLYELSSNHNRWLAPSSSTPLMSEMTLSTDTPHKRDGPSASEPPTTDGTVARDVNYRAPNALTLDYQQRFFTGWGAVPYSTDRYSSSPLKTPSLGLVWTNQIACRITLTKHPIRTQFAYGHDNTRWARHIKVVFAPWAKGDDGSKGVQFVVEGSGIKAVTAELKDSRRNGKTESSTITPLKDRAMLPS